MAAGTAATVLAPTLWERLQPRRDRALCRALVAAKAAPTYAFHGPRWLVLLP